MMMIMIMISLQDYFGDAKKKRESQERAGKVNSWNSGKKVRNY